MPENKSLGLWLKALFAILERAQQSCNLLTGESPVQVTTKGPGSYKTSVNRDGDVEASRKSVNEV